MVCLDVFSGEVDVDHGRLYLLVTQNLLKLMDTAAGPQIHGSEGVSQGMRPRFAASHASPTEHSPKDLLDSILRQRSPLTYPKVLALPYNFATSRSTQGTLGPAVTPTFHPPPASHRECSTVSSPTPQPTAGRSPTPSIASGGPWRPQWWLLADALPRRSRPGANDGSLESYRAHCKGPAVCIARQPRRRTS